MSWLRGLGFCYREELRTEHPLAYKGTAHCSRGKTREIVLLHKALAVVSKSRQRIVPGSGMTKRRPDLYRVVLYSKQCIHLRPARID